MANVVHQLRAALARPWPVSAYAEVSQRPDSKGDQCGGFAARGVTGRIRQLHALVRQQAVKGRVLGREGVALPVCRDKPAEIGGGLVLLASATTRVNP